MTEAIDRHLAAILMGDANDFAQIAAGVDAVWKRICFHGIAGLLAAQMVRLANWPEELRALVRKEAQLQAFWEESHLAMLRGLLADLTSQGVPSLLMKGSALAYSVYAHSSARRRGDSDLLVRETQLGASRAVLTARGFTRRDNPHGLFFQETWLADTGFGLVHAVDLHWQPSDSPALQQVVMVEEFFARSVTLPRLSPDAAMPDIVLTFIQGALNQAWHGAKGYFVGDERIISDGRLIWAWDNHLLARQFGDSDWDELSQMAIARGISPLCLNALRLAQSACGTVVPEATLVLLESGNKDTRLINHIRNENLISAFFTDLAAIRSPRAKLAFVLGNALPKSDHLRRKYPGIAHWPVAVLHARRMAETALRWLRAS